jgi:hypothetical protein
MKAPFSDASMAITPATVSGGAKPSPGAGWSFANSSTSMSCGRWSGVVSVIPLRMLLQEAETVNFRAAASYVNSRAGIAPCGVAWLNVALSA